MTQTIAKDMNVQLAGEREVIVTRSVNAPRELVFRAHSDAESLKQWWGPAGFTLPHCTVDFRPGGTWLYCMRGPDGQEYWGKAVYQEIDPPARIVYTDSFADAQGNETSAPMLITIDFAEAGARTNVTISTVFVSQEERDAVMALGMEEGLCQTMDRLDEFLAR